LDIEIRAVVFEKVDREVERERERSRERERERERESTLRDTASALLSLKRTVQRELVFSVNTLHRSTATTTRYASVNHGAVEPPCTLRVTGFLRKLQCGKRTAYPSLFFFTCSFYFAPSSKMDRKF